MSAPRPQRALVAVAAVLLTAACGQASTESGDSSSTTVGPVPTLEQVYAHARQSLLAGGVYHETITTTQDAGELSGTVHVERWTDAAHDRAREQLQVSGRLAGEEPSSFTRLTVGDELWQGPDEIVAAPTCHGADAATTGVIGCPGWRNGAAKTVVAWSTSDGKRVLTLTTKAPVESEDATGTTTVVTLLDPTTMLPVSLRSDGTANDQPFHSRTTVVGAFLSPASLAKGFFEPSSLGWQKPDPLASIPVKARVYWLGRSWRPGSGLPDLVLSATRAEEGLGYDAVLEYALASDRYGSPGVITIQLWRRAEWDSEHIDMTATLCEARPVRVLSGSATLYCPEPGQVEALVSLPEAVLVVDAAASQDGDKVIANPFGTVGAMGRVLQALRAK